MTKLREKLEAEVKGYNRTYTIGFTDALDRLLPIIESAREMAEFYGHGLVPKRARAFLSELEKLEG